MVEVYEVKIVEDTLEYTVSKPKFKELSTALSAMVTKSGGMDMVGGGKVIWDTCCIKYDTRIDLESGSFVGICLNLAAEYLEGLQVDIKKKSKPTS